MVTPSDLKNLTQNKNVSSTSTIFKPPTWFHCDEQTFLISHIVSIWWNVGDVDSQTIKTQISLTNGVIINVLGQNRAIFASQCLNLKANFEGNDCNGRLVFKL